MWRRVESVACAMDYKGVGCAPLIESSNTCSPMPALFISLVLRVASVGWPTRSTQSHGLDTSSSDPAAGGGLLRRCRSCGKCNRGMSSVVCAGRASPRPALRCLLYSWGNSMSMSGTAMERRAGMPHIITGGLLVSVEGRRFEKKKTPWSSRSKQSQHDG